MVLYDIFVASVGLNNTEYYKLKSKGSDLDRSHLTDTRSAENDWIGADTDPQYQIDASLFLTPFTFQLHTFNIDLFIDITRD